jgi:hypothetical protein
MCPATKRGVAYLEAAHAQRNGDVHLGMYVVQEVGSLSLSVTGTR